jgi:hypothetical protein
MNYIEINIDWKWARVEDLDLQSLDKVLEDIKILYNK